MVSKSLKDYKATQILTADPVRTVLMLYDAAITDLELASLLTKEKKYEERTKKVNHATDILFELLSSLDYDRGGDIAANLSQIYSFLVLEIVRAVQKNDPKALLRCRDILQPLREAWIEIVRRPAGIIDQNRLKDMNDCCEAFA